MLEPCVQGLMVQLLLMMTFGVGHQNEDLDTFGQSAPLVIAILCSWPTRQTPGRAAGISEWLSRTTWEQ